MQCSSGKMLEGARPMTQDKEPEAAGRRSGEGKESGLRDAVAGSVALPSSPQVVNEGRARGLLREEKG